MKVYVRTFAGGKIEVRTGESLEREKVLLLKKYLENEDNFYEFLDGHYYATDFYHKEPNESEIKKGFEEYCEKGAKYDTFGQYQEVIVDENEENPGF